jgi:transposase
MALPKPKHDQPEGEPVEREKPFKPWFGPAERLRAIHEDLLQYAPPEGEDDGWEELAEALDAERPEGMKLFPK